MVEKGTALLRKMEISVAEADKRTGKNAVNIQETYTVYLIETRYISLKHSMPFLARTSLSMS